MKKIPTLFKRDPEDMRHVLPEIVEGCEWVLAGEGVPTRKFDGTCLMFDADGAWFARREVKPGKAPPEDFIPVEIDEATGKTVGWMLLDNSSFAKFADEAIDRDAPFASGTYELCGPKINGNPEGFETHVLIRHADAPTLDLIPPEPSDVVAVYRILGEWLTSMPYEGIVWHHPDGRMAKLKKRDFT